MILSRVLKYRSKQFAISINEHPQTVNAITKERRCIDPALSINLGYALNVDWY